MRSTVVAFAFGVLLLGSSRPTFGQNPTETSLSDLHREIAELKTVLAGLTKRLEAIEQRLTQVEAAGKRPAVELPHRVQVEVRRHRELSEQSDRHGALRRRPERKLLFPVEVERAMIGEANIRRHGLREDLKVPGSARWEVLPMDTELDLIPGGTFPPYRLHGQLETPWKNAFPPARLQAPWGQNPWFLFPEDVERAMIPEGSRPATKRR
jgi:hypothetical protein